MDALWEFQSAFHDCVTRSEPRAQFFDSGVGQLRQLERQSIAPMALHVAGGTSRGLQRLLSEVRGEEEQMGWHDHQLVAEERGDLAGICFVLGVTEATVLAWLRRAAPQAEGINRHLLRDLPVTQVQLDGRWNFIARKHARKTDAARESVPDGEDGRQWIWIRFAPELRLMSAAVVGPRTLDTAQEVVAATKARVAGSPAFFSNGFPCSLAALLAAFHVVPTLARTGKRGHPRKPRYEPHPELVYGQLSKRSTKARCGRSTRTSCGEPNA
jgi:hypothetical protein